MVNQADKHSKTLHDDNQSNQNSLELPNLGDEVEENKPPANPISLKEMKHMELAVIVMGGYLLTINAGFINGITYSSLYHIPASHLSGTSPKFGLSIANDDILSAETLVYIIMWFVFGSSISGFIIPGNSFKLTRGYGPLFFIVR